MIIAFIFALCWMPLNVYNLVFKILVCTLALTPFEPFEFLNKSQVLDLHNPFQQPEDQEMMLIIYAVCHLLGMSSVRTKDTITSTLYNSECNIGVLFRQQLILFCTAGSMIIFEANFRILLLLSSDVAHQLTHYPFRVLHRRKRCRTLETSSTRQQRRAVAKRVIETLLLAKEKKDKWQIVPVPRPIICFLLWSTVRLLLNYRLRLEAYNK